MKNIIALLACSAIFTLAVDGHAQMPAPSSATSNTHIASAPSAPPIVAAPVASGEQADRVKQEQGLLDAKIKMEKQSEALLEDKIKRAKQEQDLLDASVKRAKQKDNLLKAEEALVERKEALIERQERDVARYEKILDKWEAQGHK